MTWKTTERQWSADIDSDLITFWICSVYLICKHLVTLLHLELKLNDIWVESFNNFIDETNAEAQLFSISDTLEEGMVQVGSGVAGLSSSGSSFHQSFLMSVFGDNYIAAETPADSNLVLDVVQAMEGSVETIVLDELRTLLPYCLVAELIQMYQ
ncbi:hypothetical protein Tco_1049300 [Tanacetum coccineum]